MKLLILIPILATSILQAGTFPNDSATYGNLIFSNSTAFALSPTLSQTNFVLNTVYTNSARVAHVRANASHSLAAVVGVSRLRLYADQSGGNTFTVVAQSAVTTLITSLVTTDDREVGAWLAANATYYWTNSSTGVGNGSSIASGTGQIIRW